MQQLISVMTTSADGYKGYAGGWVIEEVPNPKSDGGKNKDKVKAFAGAIGWQSVEAHLKFREHQAFKDNIHLLRGAKDLVGMDVFHVKFLEVQGPGPLSGEERGAEQATNPQEEILNPQDAPKNPPKTSSK